MSFASKSHPEAEERKAHQTGKPKPELPEPWTHYTAEQRSLVEELAAWQNTLAHGKAKGCSDAVFCKPAGADASAWNRLKRGVYGGAFGGSIDGVANTLRRHYAPQNRGLLPVAHTKVIMDGIDNARKLAVVNDEKRGFWLIGETGDGKTTLARAVEKEKDGVRIHATPAWTVSYFVILKAVAKKLGIGKSPKSTDALEADIIAHLSTSPVAKVLVFEEVQQQNARTIKELLSFWMMLLNETRAILVVLTVKEFFDDFKARGGEYATQFLRRTLVMRGSSVEPLHARSFLAAAWPDAPDLDRSARALAKAAAERGGFDLLKEVTALMKEQFNGAANPTPADVQETIDTYYQRHQFDVAA